MFERDNGNHNNLKTEIRFTFILSSIVSVSGVNLLIDSVEGKHVRVIIKPTLLSLPLGLQLGRSSYLCLLRTARPRYCGICQGGATLYVCVRFRVFFFFFTAKTKFTQLLDGGQHIELTQPHTHTHAGITFRDTTPDYFFLRRHNKSSNQSSLQILLKLVKQCQFIDHFDIGNTRCSCAKGG